MVFGVARGVDRCDFKGWGCGVRVGDGEGLAVVDVVDGGCGEEAFWVVGWEIFIELWWGF